jgi:hypothetical protein
MKYFQSVASIAVLLFLFSFIERKENLITTEAVSPLGNYSSQWNEAKYLNCNTAANVKYMNTAEKEVIYILNMARLNPTLFANTVVKQYPNKSGQDHLRNSDYYRSLITSFQKMKPEQLLYPDSLCYKSANCHAEITGKGGIVGHYRTAECQSNQYFNGECCDYGHNKPLDILLSFLIDEGVSSLGHRKICMDRYKKIGVSIQPHTGYRYTAVLDFIY